MSAASAKTLDCVACCLGEIIDKDNEVSGVGWVQITGAGNNLEEVFNSFEKNCKKKVVKEAERLSITF